MTKKTCNGVGYLICRCGGDVCVCENKGDNECPGCPACEEYFDIIMGDEEEPCCPHCGKPIYDFSDIGCGRCDRRSPEWGVL